jgi:hypothetical protein
MNTTSHAKAAAVIPLRMLIHTSNARSYFTVMEGTEGTEGTEDGGAEGFRELRKRRGRSHRIEKRSNGVNGGLARRTR